MTGPAKIRVLICDDHPILRVGVAAIIQAQPDMEVCGHAGSAAQAIQMHRERLPDLTLMDLRLPDRSSVEAIRAIRKESPWPDSLSSPPTRAMKTSIRPWKPERWVT